VTRKSSSVLCTESERRNCQAINRYPLDKPTKSTPQSVERFHCLCAFCVANEDTFYCTLGSPDLEEQEENARIDLLRRTNEEVRQRIRNLRKMKLENSKTDQLSYPVFEAQTFKRPNCDFRVALPPRLVRNFCQFGINSRITVNGYDVLKRAVKEVKVVPPLLGVDLGLVRHINSISTSRHTLVKTLSHHSDIMSPLRMKKSACIPAK
jgi:hypothetical protein